MTEVHRFISQMDGLQIIAFQIKHKEAIYKLFFRPIPPTRIGSEYLVMTDYGTLKINHIIPKCLFWAEIKENFSHHTSIRIFYSYVNIPFPSIF